MMIRGGFPAEKMIYIPTFVRTNPDEKKQPKKNQFFFAGRISPEKGLDVLFRAVAMLKSADWTLFVAGGTDSDYAQSLMASIPDAIRAKIHFDGFVPQHQVQTRILESRFVVVPSVWYENMPNVVLEAMALGRPVIASRLGSLEEMIREGENGLKFVAGNAKDLAVKIDHLLSDPNKAEEMGARAKTDMVVYHSPEGHFNTLANLFYKVNQGEYETL
jgi:glycosyltransferase involved in cell wall biosynthesis